jgi:hypothetical protein
MERRRARDAMKEAQQAIKTIGPALARSGLSLDVRAALLNLDAALTRALTQSQDNMGAGADHLEVYSRMSALRELAATEGDATLHTIAPIVRALERRGPHRG